METLADKRILITGGTGFIGTHLVRRLVAEGAEVHVIMREHSDVSKLSSLGGVVYHSVDLTDASGLTELISTIHPEGVFHLAAANQSFGHIPSLESLVRVNVEATLRLMELTKEEPLLFFVNTDTCVQVGAKPHPLRESDTLEPTELYGVSKIPGTLYAQALGRSGKPFVTLRVFTPYGPYLQKGKVLHTMITKALSGEDCTLTSATVTRDFIYIDDLIDLYIRVAQNAHSYPGEVFNAGSGVGTSLGSLANLVKEKTGSRNSTHFGASSGVSYDQALWEADMSNVQRKLSWKPSVSLEEGVQKTVTWFREHEDYWHGV